MATFKLGAIITDMQGSIGGTTIRRTPTGHTMYNKQGTQIKSAFAKYSQKNKIANIFRGWAQLSKEEQNQWQINASLYPVPDKYGNDKILTARQLFTKLNTQLLPVGESSFAESFNLDLEAPAVALESFNLSEEEVILSFGGTFEEQTILVSMYQLRKKGRVKPHAHFRRTCVQTTTSATVVSFFSLFREQFPLSQVGDNFGFNIQFMNSSGIISSVQAFTGVLE